jgi:hypothetical protein
LLVPKKTLKKNLLLCLLLFKSSGRIRERKKIIVQVNYQIIEQQERDRENHFVLLTVRMVSTGKKEKKQTQPVAVDRNEKNRTNFRGP